jgi:hypothetical protein
MTTRKPDVLVTDADTAFTPKAFRAAMDGLGVEARLRAGRNDIATVDRAIGLLKETIQRFRASSGKSDWGHFLQKVVKWSQFKSVFRRR